MTWKPKGIPETTGLADVEWNLPRVINYFYLIRFMAAESLVRLLLLWLLNGTQEQLGKLFNVAFGQNMHTVYLLQLIGAI